MVRPEVPAYQLEVCAKGMSLAHSMIIKANYARAEHSSGTIGIDEVYEKLSKKAGALLVDYRQQFSRWRSGGYIRR